MRGPQAFGEAFREAFSLILRHRRLILETAKQEITDRYLGHVFGIFWLFGHPLIMMGVYVFIFAFVFRVRIGGTAEMPLDYTTYLLAGLIPWLCFQDVLAKSSTIIASHSHLVKQVVFPIEILPVKGVITSLATMGVLLTGLGVYVLLSNSYLPWTYGLVPLLVVLQTMAMVGVGYLLAAIGVYFKDLKDFVQVFSYIGMYLMPIFYLPEAVPSLFRPLLYLNPFSYLIWPYQDALYFGRLTHWWAWLALGGLSVASFPFGFMIFRRLKPMFGHVL